MRKHDTYVISTPAPYKPRRWPIIGFFICLAILVYPLIASTWNRYRSSLLATEYEESVAEDPVYYEQLLEDAREYNRKLTEDTYYVITQKEYEEDPEYESLLDIGGQMGYIEIPSIQVTESISHYTTDEVLEEHIGHIHGSSLPAGADEETGTSHSVITGHCGLPTQKFFTDLDKVVEGDRFFLHIGSETLAYEVTRIQTVLPDEVESLVMEEGKDLVTLVTCTPYAVNSHRLLVTGERIPYTEEVIEEEENAVYMPRLDPGEILILGVLCFFLIFFLIQAILQHRRRKKARGQTADTASRGADG